MTPTEVIANGESSLIDDLILFLEESRFFVPSAELTERIVARLVALADGKAKKGSADGLFLLQRTISEQLYYHLRTWADSTEASEGKSMPLREIIGFGFGKSIGLVTEDADRTILDDIAGEVSTWIEGLNHFQAGWGEVIHAQSGSVILRAISDESGVDEAPSVVSEKQPFTEFKPKGAAKR